MIPALLLSFAAQAAETGKEQTPGLDEQVQEVKSDVLGIAVELDQLEEELLYPSSSEVALFVSIPAGDKLRLDALKVRIDGKAAADHLYTFKELQALREGGVQKLYTGNLTSGDHALEVTLIGQDAGGGKLQSTQSFTLHKEVGPKLAELSLGGGTISLKDY